MMLVINKQILIFIIIEEKIQIQTFVHLKIQKKQNFPQNPKKKLKKLKKRKKNQKKRKKKKKIKKMKEKNQQQKSNEELTYTQIVENNDGNYNTNNFDESLKIHNHLVALEKIIEEIKRSQPPIKKNMH